MRISEKEKNETIITFQRLFKNDRNAEIKVESFSLEQLRQVDEMIGDKDINAGFRIAMRNQIKRLEEKGQRIFDSKVRATYILIGLASAIVSGVIVFYVTQG